MREDRRWAVPVVAGAGSNATAEAIELAQHAKVGDAALVVTPYYNRPSQEGLYAHYAAINEAVQIPVLVYNVPARTSVDISNAPWPGWPSCRTSWGSRTPPATWPGPASSG